MSEIAQSVVTVRLCGESCGVQATGRKMMPKYATTIPITTAAVVSSVASMAQS